MQAADLLKLLYGPTMMQIFEGINQIQRMVISRDLPGVQVGR